jgi:7-carboxy-7-deazaguanine synthase
MVKTVIEAFPKEKREPRNDGSSIIRVAECFTDTIQGEGINIGQPATFLRMQFCTLSCVWCDTQEVWRQGNKYSVKELLEIFEEHGLIERFKKRQHLVLTGGSPMKQAAALAELLKEFYLKHKFTPHIEIENECVIMPKDTELAQWIKTWNNSPKLENSAMSKRLRYQPEVLKWLSEQPNSWFKFVISGDEDWQEIEEDFLKPKLIRKEQIILMPEGQTQEELNNHREGVVNLSIEKGVRFTDRLHITIWNKKTGV